MDPHLLDDLLDDTVLSGAPAESTSAVVMSRQELTEIASAIQNDTDLENAFVLFASLNKTSLELALSTLCILAEHCVREDQKEKLFFIVRSVLDDPLSTRSGRKAAISALKVVAHAGTWEVFSNLIEALEEPQFHIVRPALVTFDTFYEEARKRDGYFYCWVWTVLKRASLHSNGWIRLWGLEKSLELGVAFYDFENSPLITQVIPQLNCTDILWRLVERGIFHKTCSTLGRRLVDYCDYLDSIRAKNFVLSLLDQIAELTCPFTLFFLSEALKPLDRPVVAEEHLELLRKIISRLHSIPYTSLKNAAFGNFVDFFARIVDWSRCPIRLFVPFSSLVSQMPNVEINNLLKKRLAETIEKRRVEILVEEMCEMVRHTDWNYETEDPGWLIWEFAFSAGDEVAGALELELEKMLVESIDEGRPLDDLQGLIGVWMRKPHKNSARGAKELKATSVFLTILTDFFYSQILMLKGVGKGGLLITKFFLPPHAWFPNAVRLLPMCGRLLDSADCTIRHEFMAYSILEQYIPLLSTEAIQSYEFKLLIKSLVENVAANPLNAGRTGNSSPPAAPRARRELQKMAESIGALKVKLFRTYLLETVKDWDKLLEDVFETIDCASSFDRKLELLKLAEEAIQHVKNEALLVQLVAVSANVQAEELKSINSLTAAEQVMRLVTNKRMLEHEETREKALELFDSYLQSASLSLPVALVLAQALREAQDRLTKEWASRIVDLAIFGPIPRKDGRVVATTYGVIFDDIDFVTMKAESEAEVVSLVEELFTEPNEEDRKNGMRLATEAKAVRGSPAVERLHEIVARTRLIGSCLAVNCASRDEGMAAALLSAILERCSEFDKSSSRTFGLSFAHRAKTRVVQLMLLVLSTRDSRKLEILPTVVDYCIQVIQDPCQQFSIKLIVEWILAYCACQDDGVLEKIISVEKELSKSRIGSVTSWLNILVLYAKSKKDNLEVLTRLLSLIVPWTTAQNFSVRCSAIAAAHLLYGHLPEAEKPKWTLVKAIMDFDGEPAGNARRVIENLLVDFYFAKLEPVAHLDLQTVLNTVSTKTGMPDDELIPDRLITSLNDTKMKGLSDDEQFLAAETLVYNSLAKCNTCAPEMTTEEDSERISAESGYDFEVNGTEPESTSLQRKIVTAAWQKPLDCSLIVVASLVDKPANLGGLCRTSEIFGVDSLVLNDVLQAKNLNFKALSMSSENWQKLEGVRPDDLMEYLKERRQAGYTVVAAEQTTDSTPLDKFAFPKKCVLLVGDEREGVPTRLLRYVDQTVEIKQFGQTRSLNVHVTAALFISRYAEQHFCA
ncbi:unnamed protein product, partial [Mesorhabditis spiculigera]